MKKLVFTVIITALFLLSTAVCFAENDQDQTGQMGEMMSGNSMMGHHGMMSQQAGKDTTGTRRCPMSRMGMDGMPMCSMMGKTMATTANGGVVVMIGNKLYKYDKNLDLKKETEVKIDYDSMKKMMNEMNSMNMMNTMQ